MKRFLLGALGTLGVGSMTLLQAGNLPSMPKVDDAAPAAKQPAAPAKEAAPPATPKLPAEPLCSQVHGNGCAPVIDKGVWCNADPGCGGGWSFVAGVEALFLRPQFTSNPAFTNNQTTSTTAGAAGIPTGITTNVQVVTDHFSYDWSVSPRIWVGAENDGMGVRASWFHFDQAADRANTITSASGPGIGVFPATTVTVTATSALGGITGQTNGLTATGAPIPANDVLSATSGLFLDVWDAEFTMSGRVGGFDLVGSGGVRYAYIEQTYNVFHPGVTTTGAFFGLGFDPGATTFVSDTLASRQTFTGAGPTFGMEVIRRMSEGRFGLFANGRGSVLFGRGHQESDLASVRTTSFTGVAPFTTSTRTRTDSGNWDVLPVLELEVGAQINLGAGDNATLFVRPAFVGQAWFDGGSATSRTGDFGLVGFSLTAGIGF